MSTAEIHRATLFKINGEEALAGAIEQYSSMQANAKKDSKPYILTLRAGRILPGPRNEGYNLGVFATYASLSDMQYYDESDSAHDALKGFLKGKVAGPPLVVFFEDAVGAGVLKLN